MPRIGPLKGDLGGGRQRREPVHQSRVELGPIKSESIFVEGPIKPLESLIDCSSPIRGKEGRGLLVNSILSAFAIAAAPFLSPPHCHLLIDPVHMTLKPQLTHPPHAHSEFSMRILKGNQRERGSA